MGSFSAKQKTSSKSSGTATTTPQVPGFIKQPAEGFYSAVGNLLNQPASTMATAPTANQNAAFAGASSLGGNSAILDAINGSRGLMSFTPDSVQAGQLRDTNLSPYMNPYTNDVIDTSVRDLERARAGAITAGQGNATMSGAYGGSRHGIADAETNRGFMDSVGSLVANLRNAGYQNAQTAALADINNRLGADTGNADRNITGAGLRLNAANQTGSLGLSSDNNQRQNLATQAGLGEMERQIATENDPQQARMEQLRKIAELLGISPGNFIGQQINESSASSGSSSASPSLIDSLGKIMQIGQMFVGKPG